MDSPDSIVLTILLFWPLVAALLVLLLGRSDRQIKSGSIWASLLPLGLSIYLLFAYNSDTGGMQFEQIASWIPQLNAGYHLGVDGLSVPLIFLTTLLSALSIYYSAGAINQRVKEYFFLMFLLEFSMLGVFMALDYVLFYVFWEISLVPMYFLIGIWGGENRGYAATKFFIYTLVGSVAMLLAILGVYFATGTFDIVEAAAAQPFAGNLTLASLAFWGFFLGFAFKVPSFPSTPGCPTPIPRRRPPVRSSWPASCLSWGPTACYASCCPASRRHQSIGPPGWWRWAQSPSSTAHLSVWPKPTSSG